MGVDGEQVCITQIMVDVSLLVCMIYAANWDRVVHVVVYSGVHQFHLGVGDEIREG